MIDQELISAMIALVFSQCLTPRVSAWQIFYLRPIFRILPNNLEKHPMTIALFLDGSRSCPAVRVASSAPEARRRCIGRLRKAMPPWSSSWSLRGPRWTRPTKPAVAPEGFWGRFGCGSDEVTEGVRTLAADFLAVLWDVEWYPYLLFKSTFCAGMGLLKFGQTKWDEASRKQKESRGLKVFTGFVSLKWFWAWSHICLWNCDRRMVWNDFWQQSCQIFSLPAVERSDFIFVAGMYPEIEKKDKNGKHMGSFKEQLWSIDCPRLDATKHWKLSMTNAVRAMGLGTWVNPIGYLGVQGTQASYFLKSKHHHIFLSSWD